MKTINKLTGITVFAMAVILCGATPAAFSQDRDGNGPEKRVVKIRIEKEENGKTTVLDTTFNLTDAKSREGYRYFMRSNDLPARGQGRPMKKVVIRMDDLSDSDSITVDSVKQIEKTFKIISDGDVVRIDGLGEMELGGLPAPPEPPAPPCIEGFDFNGPPCQFHGTNGSLMEMLQSIPMNRVKSFRIKESKNGSKIIIEVDRAPLFDRPAPPRDPHYYHYKKQHRNAAPGSMEKVIIIDSDQDKPEGKK